MNLIGIIITPKNPVNHTYEKLLPRIMRQMGYENSIFNFRKDEQGEIIKIKIRYIENTDKDKFLHLLGRIFIGAEIKPDVPDPIDFEEVRKYAYAESPK